MILKRQKAVKDPDGVAGTKTCSGYFSEDERVKIQKSFPLNKVFASRVGCEMYDQTYTNSNSNENFVAVYGGTTLASANKVLRKARTSGFAKAQFRRMQAVYYNGD